MNNASLLREAKAQTLMSVLRRAHLNIVLTVTTIVGLSLTVIGVIALMTYAEDSLQLISHAISYNAEAASVFEDRSAAFQSLQSMASTEDVSSASITDRQGKILAQWTSPSHGLFVTLSHWGVILLNEKSVVTPIIHDGVTIGQVTVRPSGRNLLSYILGGLVGIIVGQALIVIISFYLSRNMLACIVGPLQSFSRIAHSVCQDRNFELRMPNAAVAELNGLAEDFNALLDELGEWQAHLRNEHDSLEHKASHDGLTGLSNRVLFQDRLAKAMSEADRLEGNLAVLFMDCDHFKQINDKFGHAAGDAVLIAISQRIKGQVRANDLAVRLGGDEFALLISPIRQLADALKIADLIKASMQAPIVLPGGESVIASLSVGVAVYPDHASDAETLLRAADLAMYRAKFTLREMEETGANFSDHSVNPRMKEQ